MRKKYILESSKRAARNARCVAKIIDFFICALLMFFFYPFGVLLGAAYLALCDGMQRGQSFGKRFIGFAVLSLEDGQYCSIKQSVIRNLPFVIPVIFAIIPFWGWFLTLMVGGPFLALEAYLLYKLDSGHRLGDVMADTTVIANDPTAADFKKKKQSWFDQEKTAIPS